MALVYLINDSNQLLGKLNSRSAEISDALTQTSQLADRIDAKNQAITDIVTAAGPATETLAANTAQLSELLVMAGDTTKQLQKFPSIAGTDTSGRSVIKDANTVAKAWNDVALDPDTSLAAFNRIMPTAIKATAGNSLSLTAGIDQLVLGSIPDAGSHADTGLHGPKRYNWAQLVGSVKYTLWRLQERVVGQGAYGQEVPVRPSPTEPGVIETIPPAPGGGR